MQFYLAICISILFSKAHSQYASRFLGFSLYVSNTTVKEDGMLCYKDTNFTAASIPPTMNISCDVLGRFVIYYNSRKNLSPINHDYSPKVFNNLCEVEVYGTNEYFMQYHIPFVQQDIVFITKSTPPRAICVVQPFFI